MGCVSSTMLKKANLYLKLDANIKLPAFSRRGGCVQQDAYIVGRNTQPDSYHLSVLENNCIAEKRCGEQLERR